MNFNITTQEIKELFLIIKEEPTKLYEMMEVNMQKHIGKYLSKLIDLELTDHLGRKPYQRAKCSLTPKNYRNGSYNRKFLIKRIGEVGIKVPRDRNNEFHTQVLPKAKRYDKRISNDLHAMFLRV
ncbi:MAG: hypothetical protein EVG15_08830 [Candidatus Acididesulfobacter diazotrophicus]|jgi:putative transposase|uniref:Mutator family transposase n=1 Tax=Candidatus Acididesulfobacter diazotrophicus TaxID=2597226 RepID=A0A519BKY4_9DELT|nr:MAG: hypothetical protein EVG15_08830 [Candidatus Acididesulfobacter diazotrophicus]